MNYKTKGVLAFMLVALSGMMLFACGKDPMDAKLTVSNYNTVVVGTTTYTQAKDLFGEPAEDEKLTDGDGTITWSNKSESKTVTLTFEDNVVTDKAQTGLI